MKNVYEQPVMMAELYKTNAYCGACDKTRNGQLMTSPGRSYSNDSKGKWNAGYGVTSDQLTHYFDPEPNPDINSVGLCSSFGRQEHTEAERHQDIWTCNCCETPWFLEWSHYYNVHRDMGDVYFLYKDVTDIGNFNIVKQGGSYPTKEDGSDINVAMVIFDTVMVENS